MKIATVEAIPLEIPFTHGGKPFGWGGRAWTHLSILLVRVETSPADIRGMEAAEGILTQRGGMTSHAALVARQMGKVCVACCGALSIDYDAKTLTVAGRTFAEGDWLSLDGSTGEVLAGRLETQEAELEELKRKVRTRLAAERASDLEGSIAELPAADEEVELELLRRRGAEATR